MRENLECKTVSPLLVGHIKGSLNKQERALVEEHLQNCAKCQGIVDSLELTLRESHEPKSNLWPMFRSRLTAFEETEEVHFKWPSISWRVLVAAVVIVLTLLVVPDPLLLLAATGLF